MLYKKWLDKKDVIGKDWPLSLGSVIKFASTNKNFVNKKFTVSKKKMALALEKGKNAEGMAAYWANENIYVIAINYNGKSAVRFIELVTHEVSHIIDYILKNCVIKNVDTELRAYLQDWITGKILHNTIFNSYEIKKFKKEKK